MAALKRTDHETSCQVKEAYKPAKTTFPNTGDLLPLTNGVLKKKKKTPKKRKKTSKKTQVNLQAKVGNSAV
jgi:hypothetical protein